MVKLINCLYNAKKFNALLYYPRGFGLVLGKIVLKQKGLPVGYRKALLF